MTNLDTGLINGAPVTELAAVGIRDYRTLVTSHHGVRYRKIEKVTDVYAIAGHQQDSNFAAQALVPALIR